MLYTNTTARTRRELAACRKKRRSLHYGTMWLALVKTAAACFLVALLIFVYAAGAAKWWGVPFMLAFAAIAVALPCACAYYTREIVRLERELKRLETENDPHGAARGVPFPAVPVRGGKS